RSRQRIDAGVREPAAARGRSQQRNSKRIRRRSSGVAQDVVEEDIVAGPDSTANHRLVLAEEPARNVRRIGEAKPRSEVVVVALLFCDSIERPIESRERRERNDVETCPIVLVAEAQIQTQVRLQPPRVVYEVRLLERVGMSNRASKSNRSECSLCPGKSVNKVTEHREPAAR